MQTENKKTTHLHYVMEAESVCALSDCKILLYVSNCAEAGKIQAHNSFSCDHFKHKEKVTKSWRQLLNI